MFWLPVAASIAALATLIVANVSTQCPRPDLCFSISVSSASVNSETGDDVFIQVVGSTNYGYVALSREHSSTHANYLFVSPTQNSNITAFSRLVARKGQVLLYTKIELLDGSGVKDGIMTANIRYSNCISRPGGSLDIAGSIASWIWTYIATKISNPANPISGTIIFDYSATAGPPGNPSLDSLLVNRAAPITRAEFSHGPPPRVIKMYTAHAIFACVAWSFIFPLGGILIRLFSFRNLLWVHAVVQISGLCLYTAAVGLGIQLSINPKHWRMNNKHVIIGLTIYIMFIFQAASGYIHHLMFKKYFSRTAWSHTHLWTGRFCVTLGMINAGFGFQITKKDMGRWEVVLYTVCTALVWIAYMASAVIGEWRKKKQGMEAVGGFAAENGTSADDSSAHTPQATEIPKQG